MDDSKIIIKLLKEQQKTLLKLEKKITSLTTDRKKIFPDSSAKKNYINKLFRFNKINFRINF